MVGLEQSLPPKRYENEPLENWKRPNKAKVEWEFVIELLDATHAYIAEMSKPVTFMRFVKTGMEAHVPTWEEGDDGEKAIKGAITYIQKNGEADSKRLQGALEEAQPSQIRLSALAAKGQVLNLDGYVKAFNAAQLLTWQFRRIEALMALVSSPTFNWEHPQVIAIDPDEVDASLKENNRAVLEFVRDTYARIYAAQFGRLFLWAKRRSVVSAVPTAAPAPPGDDRA